MTDQIIYSRYEYPLGNRTSDDVFKEFHYDRSQTDVDGRIIKGISACVRFGPDPAIIILTYDRESDSYMRLKLCGRKDVIIRKLNQRKNNET